MNIALLSRLQVAFEGHKPHEPITLEVQGRSAMAELRAFLRPLKGVRLQEKGGRTSITVNDVAAFAAALKREGKGSGPVRQQVAEPGEMARPASRPLIAPQAARLKTEITQAITGGEDVRALREKYGELMALWRAAMGEEQPLNARIAAAVARDLHRLCEETHGGDHLMTQEMRGQLEAVAGESQVAGKSAKNSRKR